MKLHKYGAKYQKRQILEYKTAKTAVTTITTNKCSIIFKLSHSKRLKSSTKKQEHDFYQQLEFY